MRAEGHTWCCAGVRDAYAYLLERLGEWEQALALHLQHIEE